MIENLNNNIGMCTAGDGHQSIFIWISRDMGVSKVMGVPQNDGLFHGK